MKTAQKRRGLPGTLLIVAGVMVAVLAKVFEETSYKFIGAAKILAIILIAWGIAVLLYLLDKTVLWIAAPVLLLMGILFFIGGMINGSTTGIIVGGLLVVIGVVLMPQK
ncbi:MAG TPA: hypothetical protein VFC07_08405 [Verrucomicrobiae bacterium]|nr:hypothetical protein [Verrucomicrobiae bacterium]